MIDFKSGCKGIASTAHSDQIGGSLACVERQGEGETSHRSYRVLALVLDDLVLRPTVPTFLAELRPLDPDSGIVFADPFVDGEGYQYAKHRKHIAGFPRRRRVGLHDLDDMAAFQCCHGQRAILSEELLDPKPTSLPRVGQLREAGGAKIRSGKSIEGAVLADDAGSRVHPH